MTDHPTPEGHVRIGDRERAQAAERLSAHAAAGRLGIDELEQRLERANAAVFAADLDALEADLPGRARPRAGSGWRPPVVPVAALVCLIVAVAVASTVAIGHPIVPLFLLAVLLWRRGARFAPARWSR